MWHVINHARCLGIIAAAVLLAGCGGEKIPELTAVEGTLKLKGGGALGTVEILFLPDPEEEEVVGRPAKAMTDASGKFVLHYNGDKSKPGAVVGWNRVVLRDILAIRTARDENPTLRRIAGKYSDTRTTDLKFEIKSGEKQTINIEVDPQR